MSESDHPSRVTRRVARELEERALFERVAAEALTAPGGPLAHTPVGPPMSAEAAPGNAPTEPPVASLASQDPTERDLAAIVARLEEQSRWLTEAVGLSRTREARLRDRVDALEAQLSHLLRGHASGRKLEAVEEEDEVTERNSRRAKLSTRRGGTPKSQRSRPVLDRNTPSEASTSDEEEAFSLADSDEVPMGPRVAGLVELSTRRPEFRPLVNYRTYRLKDRSQRVDDSVTHRVNTYIKMLRHHVTEPFSGDPAIQVFDFLSALRDACDVNRISEGAASLLLPHFLTGKAKAGVVGRWKQVSSAMPKYPVAVQYLLQSYATHRVIAASCQRVMSARQEPNESETQFGERLGRYASEAGNVFTEDLLISVFIDGLQPFAAHTVRSRIQDDMTFAQVQQEAEDAGLAGRALFALNGPIAGARMNPTRVPPAKPRATVASLSEPYFSSDAPSWNDYATAATQPFEAAVADCAPGNASYAGSDLSAPTRGWASVAGSAAEEPVDVMAVSSHSRGCFLCFEPGHFLQECPQLTPEQRALAQRNREALPPRGRGYSFAPSHGNRATPSYGYSRMSGQHVVHSDAKPPFRPAVWGVTPGFADPRGPRPGSSNPQQIAAIESLGDHPGSEEHPPPVAENPVGDA
jgi:hypothetical protein